MFGLIDKSDKNEALTEFKDPFNKESVDYINISLHKKTSMFRDGKRHTATIYMKSGSTRGDQTFTDDDINNLFNRIQLFINQL